MVSLPARAFRTMQGRCLMPFLLAAFVVCAVLAMTPGKAQVFGYIFAPLYAVMTWRFWVMGVYAEPGGVKIVNIWRTKTFPWAEVDRFDVQPYFRIPYQGYVLLKGEEEAVPILAISAGRPKTERGRGKVQKQVDGLNEALAIWREHSLPARSLSRTLSPTPPNWTELGRAPWT